VVAEEEEEKKKESQRRRVGQLFIQLPVIKGIKIVETVMKNWSRARFSDGELRLGWEGRGNAKSVRRFQDFYHR